MPTFNTREAFEESYPNVKGSAIGPNGELLVLVTRKYSEDELAADEIVPDDVIIADTTRETDLIEVGIPHLISASEDAKWYATVPEDHRRRYRPIPGGVSIGNNSIGAGTMGSPLLEHEESGDPVTLTNAHVAGEAYEQFQPSSLDGGAEAEPIGTLREASHLNPDEPQTTDSALIDVDPEDIDETILGIGPLNGFDRADFTHDQYTKSGRTTGVTEAPLRGVDANVRVTYGPETILFEGCDVFGDLSKPGDSGSLIGYEDENDDGLIATSLLFAGSSVATIGVPLNSVQEYHGELTIPGGNDGGGGDSGNGNGSDDSSDGSSGGGSDDGSDSDDNDNGEQDHKGGEWGQWHYQAKLDRVIDGDSYVFTIDLGFYTIRRKQIARLLGIDTNEIFGVKKESDEYKAGKAQKTFVEEWFAEAESQSPTDEEFPLVITTQKDSQGKYGRWLVHVTRKFDGASLKDDLLAEFGDSILYE